MTARERSWEIEKGGSVRGIIPTALAGLSCLAIAVRAEVPPDGSAKLKASLAEFSAAAQKSREDGRPPRLAYPAEAAILAKVWDASSIMGQPPYTARDAPLLLDALGSLNAVLKAYTFFSPDPAKAPDTARNGTLFQDEIVRSLAVLIRAQAAVVPAMTDFFAKLKPEQITEVRLRGLRQSRVGLVETLTGAVLTTRSPGLRSQNQAILARSLAQYGEAIAAELKRDDRVAVVAVAQSALPSLPEGPKTDMRTFIAAMSADTCEGLCRLD